MTNVPLGQQVVSRIVAWDSEGGEVLQQVLVPGGASGPCTRLDPRGHEALVVTAVERYRREEKVHFPGKEYTRWR